MPNPDDLLSLLTSANLDGVLFTIHQNTRWEVTARRPLPAETPRYAYAIGFWASADLHRAISQAIHLCWTDYERLEPPPLQTYDPAQSPPPTLNILNLLNLEPPKPLNVRRLT